MPVELRGRRLLDVNPGGLAQGGAESVLTTLLGSCVALLFWDPEARQGAMAHYLLASRPLGTGSSGTLDARYGDEAFELLRGRAPFHGNPPERWRVKLFGAGEMTKGNRVASANANMARHLCEHAHLRVEAADLGGPYSRALWFDVATGSAWVRRLPWPEDSRCRSMC